MLLQQHLTPPGESTAIDLPYFKSTSRAYHQLLITPRKSTLHLTVIFCGSQPGVFLSR